MEGATSSLKWSPPTDLGSSLACSRSPALHPPVGPKHPGKALSPAGVYQVQATPSNGKAGVLRHPHYGLRPAAPRGKQRWPLQLTDDTMSCFRTPLSSTQGHSTFSGFSRTLEVGGRTRKSELFQQTGPCPPHLCLWRPQGQGRADASVSIGLGG